MLIIETGLLNIKQINLMESNQIDMLRNLECLQEKYKEN